MGIMSTENIYGSEWIKCDLHVHTPFSISQHYGDSSSDEVWENFIKDLESLDSNFKVIGINDYIFIEGYKKVLEFKKKGRLKNLKLILPVVELRIDKFANVSDGDPFSRVNYHVIFSDELNPDVIESQFLNSLQSNYKIHPDYIDNDSDWGGVITRENLINLGDKIKESSNGKVTGGSLMVGFSSLNISLDTLKDKLHNNPRLKDKYLTAIGKTEWDTMRWTGSIADKKTVINSVDFVFTASENIDAYKKAKEKLIEQGVNDLLLDCSDAHSFSSRNEVKDRIGNCNTWIKINPTFEGLSYLKYEPEDRIFVGEHPEVLSRVDKNRTRYIDKLEIDSIDSYSGSEGIWFDKEELYFSKELTAIIGNKGKGKSAVTDILGLLGNSHNYEHFSFLNDDKFRRKKLAENFNASLTWVSNDVDDNNLYDRVDANSVEKVKYIPQSYFEDLCNELDVNSNFRREIDQVVFQHIDKAKRLGKNNFSEFIDEMKKEPEANILQAKEKLRSINSTIIQLQDKSTDRYLKNLQSKISSVEADIRSLEKTKPVKPEGLPDEKPDDKSSEDSFKKIDESKKTLVKLQNEEQILKNSLEALNSNSQGLKNIRAEFQTEEARRREFRTREILLLEKFDINIEAISPNVEFNYEPIDEKLLAFSNQKTLIELELGILQFNNEVHNDLIPEPKNLLTNKLKLADKEYNELTKLLNTQQRIQEKYKNELEDWNKKMQSLVGSEESPNLNSLFALNKNLEYININLQDQLSDAKKDREKVVREIYNEKKLVVNVYNQVKENIDRTLAENADEIAEYKITLESSLEMYAFRNSFLEFIDKGKSGAFFGSEQAEKRVRTLLRDTDPNDIESIILFVELIQASLEKTEDGNKQDVFEQIKSTKNIEELYAYLFNLDYLVVKYELKFSGKSIEQLSPGERGAALIVFYLLLDQDDKPLIIDQPEDNLDNQSVYNILVPFIKKAKKRRQLIIVTHNPNLAVVSDAEQVIHVELKKNDNNVFEFRSGGIEDPEINKSIVDILEGTMPAFDKRKLKYLKEKV